MKSFKELIVEGYAKDTIIGDIIHIDKVVMNPNENWIAGNYEIGKKETANLLGTIYAGELSIPILQKILKKARATVRKTDKSFLTLSSKGQTMLVDPLGSGITRVWTEDGAVNLAYQASFKMEIDEIPEVISGFVQAQIWYS